MVEQERGQDPSATLVGQKLQRGEHLSVLPAVERSEEGLERAQVESRKRGSLQEPSLPDSGAEHVEVVGPQSQRDAGPQKAREGGCARDQPVAAAPRDHGEDEDRRQGLPAARSEHVDRRLGRGPERLGHRHEQQLDPHAVERGSQRAVSGLEQQGSGQAGAGRDDHRPRHHDERQHRQRTAHAQRAHQPAGEEELSDDGERVQRQVEGREEAPEPGRLDGLGDGALEDVVAEGERDRREQDEDGDAGQVWVTRDRPNLERRGGGVDGRLRVERPSRGGDDARGADSGEEEEGSRCGQQVVRVEAARHPAGDGRAGHRAQLAAEPDRHVEPSRLRDRVDLAEQQPERHGYERRREPRPDVERAQRPRPAKRCRPEEKRSAGGDAQERRQRSTAGQPAGLRPREEDGQRGHRQVHPGELMGGQPRQEQGVSRGLQDRVRGEPTEKDEKGRQGDATFFRPDVEQPGPRRPSSGDARRGVRRQTAHACAQGQDSCQPARSRNSALTSHRPALAVRRLTPSSRIRNDGGFSGGREVSAGGQVRRNAVD